MEVVSVNTSKTGNPAGLWKANPNHLKNCNYVIEVQKNRIVNVYEFTDVTKPAEDGWVAFLGMKKVTDGAVIERMNNAVNVSTKQGAANPVKYHKI